MSALVVYLPRMSTLSFLNLFFEVYPAWFLSFRRNIDLVDLYEVFQTYFPLYLLRNLLHLSYESQYGIREIIESRSSGNDTSLLLSPEYPCVASKTHNEGISLRLAS